MGHRSSASLLTVGLVVLAPMLGGCALLVPGPLAGGGPTGSGAPPIAVASPVVETVPTPGGSPQALPAADRLAVLLGPDDFISVGVPGAGTPTVNGEPGSAYVVYSGPSAGGGGIEMDVSILGTPEEAAAMVVDPGMFALDAASKQQTGADRATIIEASATNDGTSTYDSIRVQKGRLWAEIGIPTTATSHDQLVALAKLVLDRSTEYQ